MKAAMRTWLALVLASSLARGEAAPSAADPTPAPAPAPAPTIPSDRVIDLDFSEDFPAHDRVDAASGGGGRKPAGKGTRTKASAAPIAVPEPARAWIYWTLGFTGLAAGGAAWYLHWAGGTAPDPVRKDQVFTDDPD